MEGKMANEFDFMNAFSRNLGFLTKEEQKLIKTKKIAIPGMGGVGGHHLHTLIRMGFQRFNISDFDEFEVHNFNRQIGAKMSTVGKQKTDAMKELALDINPEAEINIFPEGVNESNYDEFLDGVDILLDGLDVYAIKPRIGLFKKAHEKKIPIVTAAPLGMGTSVMAFRHDKMTFGDYFQIDESLEVNEMMIKFLAGIAPTMMHSRYLAAMDEIDVAKGKVPSLHVGCLAATSALGSVALKLALGRGDIIWAPRGFHVDFYLNRYKHFWRPFGNKNPLQKLLIEMIKRRFT